MKIIRLKKGYRIELSDTDFDLISGLISDGIHTYEGDEGAYAAYLSATQKAAWTRRERGGAIMRIDEDLRSLNNNPGGAAN